MTSPEPPIASSLPPPTEIAAYHPTPLEEAYASFLIATEFPSDKDEEGNIRIPGRKAVPFLTTSGVERSILRNIWTTADPNGSGTILEIFQLCTLLKLVSLTQANFITVDTTNLSEVLLLHGNNVAISRLPVFSSVETPTHTTLMQTYGSSSALNQLLQTPTLAADINSAFDDMIQVQDAPLPSLGAAVLSGNEQFIDSIVSTAAKLPDYLRYGTQNGQMLDFAEVLESHVDQLGPEQKERCQQVHELLGHNHEISIHWNQVCTITQKEATLAISLLQEAGVTQNQYLKGCSSSTESGLHNVRSPLQSMVSSVGENMRLVRCIVATIGDLLGLNPTEILSVDNVHSTWCSLSFCVDTLEAERLWRELDQLVFRLGLERVSGSLETVSEIRCTALDIGAAWGDDGEGANGKRPRLCQLTLQKLQDNTNGADGDGSVRTTKSCVQWKDLDFMACAANFMSRKITV